MQKNESLTATLSGFFMLPFGIAGRAVASSRDRCPLFVAWDFLLVGGDEEGGDDTGSV